MPRKPKTDNRVFKPVEPKTDGQADLIDAILTSAYTIVVGPAGTGKTLISSAVGVELLLEGKFSKMILTRPIVATEDIGYLPGDSDSKINPYMIPLYTELNSMINVEEYIKQKKIIVSPVAYMRGCTFKNSIIICDEAQNLTFSQLKLLLTRCGQNSKLIINGDLHQSDLPHGHSGLQKVIDKLESIDDENILSICYLTEKDIVRSHEMSVILKHLEK